MIVTRQQQVDHIMQEFNFVQVHAVMVALDWEWATLPGGRGVPNVIDVQIAAKRLLANFLNEGRDTINCESVCHSTGGFEAGREGDILYLRFVIEEWAGDDSFGDVDQEFSHV